MKKTLAVVLALVLTMAFSMSAMAEEPYKIAINLKTLSSEYWQNVKSGCDAAVTDGVEIEVQGAAAETEIAEQVAQLETQLRCV